MVSTFKVKKLKRFRHLILLAVNWSISLTYIKVMFEGPLLDGAEVVDHVKTLVSWVSSWLEVI